MQLLYDTQKVGNASIPMRIWRYIQERKSTCVRLTEMALIAAIFFGLGMVYAWDIAAKKVPIQIIEPMAQRTTALAVNAISAAPLPESKRVVPAAKTGEYVASKNGTKYYSNGCPNRIAEKNKIYFTTRDDAEKAGYSLAKNCSPQK